jgi:hypothetical protein
VSDRIHPCFSFPTRSGAIKRDRFFLLIARHHVARFSLHGVANFIKPSVTINHGCACSNETQKRATRVKPDLWIPTWEIEGEASKIFVADRGIFTSGYAFPRRLSERRVATVIGSLWMLKLRTSFNGYKESLTMRSTVSTSSVRCLPYAREREISLKIVILFN